MYIVHQAKHFQVKEDKNNFSHYKVAIKPSKEVKESSGDALKLVFNKNDRPSLENWMTELEKCKARRDGNFFNTLQQLKEDNEMPDYVCPNVIKTTALDIMNFKDFMTAIGNGGRWNTLTMRKSKAALRPKLTTDAFVDQRPESGISSIRSSQSIE